MMLVDFLHLETQKKDMEGTKFVCQRHQSSDCCMTTRIGGALRLKHVSHLISFFYLKSGEPATDHTDLGRHVQLANLVDFASKIQPHPSNVDFQPPSSPIEVSSTCLHLLHLSFSTVAQV
jgi:hypothetical protein